MGQWERLRSQASGFAVFSMPLGAAGSATLQVRSLGPEVVGPYFKNYYRMGVKSMDFEPRTKNNTLFSLAM